MPRLLSAEHRTALRHRADLRSSWEITLPANERWVVGALVLAQPIPVRCDSLLRFYIFDREFLSIPVGTLADASERFERAAGAFLARIEKRIEQLIADEASRVTLAEVRDLLELARESIGLCAGTQFAGEQFASGRQFVVMPCASLKIDVQPACDEPIALDLYGTRSVTEKIPN